MMTTQYSDWDEFYNDYEKPHMSNMIVGYAGVDPAPKSGSSQKQTAQAITNFFESQSIVLDCNG